MEQTSLYRYFSGDGTLLYVGISHHPFKRETQHECVKDMRLVARIGIDWFKDRGAAKRAESKAIKKEKPLWNVAETKPKRPKKKSRPAPDYLAGVHDRMAEFNALPFCVQIAEMNRVDAKAPRIKSIGSYANWKGKGFPGFNRPVEEPETDG